MTPFGSMAFMRSSMLHDALPALRGQGVVLRAPQASDFTAWSGLRDISRDHLQPYEPAWAIDELDHAAYRDRLKRYQREAKADQGYAFFVVSTAAGRPLVGAITLSNVRRGVSQTAAVGYWIGAPFVRRGYARAALRRITQFAFEDLRLHRLEAACMPANIASLRTLETAGFLREGIGRNYLKINNRWQDHILFGLTREDWTEVERL